MDNERRKNDEILKLKLDGIHKDIESLEKTHSKKFDMILEYNKRQDESNALIRRLVTGNGNPEDGYIAKHAKLEVEVKEGFKSILKTLAIHWALLAGIAMLIAGSVVRFIFFMPK